MEQFLLSVLASLVAVGIVLLFERQRRADVTFEIEPEPVYQPNGREFLRVRVRNKAMPRLLRLIYEREPARMCRAWITFLTSDGQFLFRPQRRMQGRWADSPEPFRQVSIANEPEKVMLIADPYETWNDTDIPPGEFEILDVLMRPPDEKSVMAGATASYWRKPGHHRPLAMHLRSSAAVTSLRLNCELAAGASGTSFGS